jgi:hypothetical protein
MHSFIRYTRQLKDLYESTILYLIPTFIDLCFDDRPIVLVRSQHHCGLQHLLLDESATFLVHLVEGYLKGVDRGNYLGYGTGLNTNSDVGIDVVFSNIGLGTDLGLLRGFLYKFFSVFAEIIG